MAKSVYFYQNEEDFLQFVNYINSLDVKVYTYYGDFFDIATYKYDCSQRYLFYILEKAPGNASKKCHCVKDNINFIEICTQFNTGVFLQCGRIAVNVNNKDNYVLHIFELIKKYIKTNYLISDDKMYYVGVNIASEWNERKIEFPNLFKRNEIIVASGQFSFKNFVRFTQEKGYLIKENGEDIRKSGDLNLLGDAYILCKTESNIKTAILNRKLYYLSGSNCIFLWKTCKKGTEKYAFQLDYRLKDDAELNELFHIIEDYIKLFG